MPSSVLFRQHPADGFCFYPACISRFDADDINALVFGQISSGVMISCVLSDVREFVESALIGAAHELVSEDVLVIVNTITSRFVRRIRSMMWRHRRTIMLPPSW